MKAIASLGGVSLYSATCKNGSTNLALEYHTDLFRIGGLFASRSSVREAIERACDDLKLPIRIAVAILKAEEAASPAPISV